MHKDINVVMEAAACAGAFRAESAVPALIEALSDERASMREAAINALTDITARTMWYHFDDPPEKRAEAIEKWRKWWQEQKNSENPENERH
jgi:predicted esterase